MYRLLLHALPRSFRDRFGSEMEQLYRDRLAEAEGLLGRWLIRLDAWRDVLWHGLVERATAVQGLLDSMRGGAVMDGWIQDLRYGVRTLSRRPGFTATAVLTLALGIGATVSIFSVVHAVLLSPLPYPDSDRLVVLWAEHVETGDRSRGTDHPDVRALQADIPGIQIAGYHGARPTVTGLGDPQVVYGSRVTDGIITLMGLAPKMGRDLTAADDIAGGPQVIVVSHSFWTNYLGADPEPLGRTVMLSGGPWEVVGVGPEGFDYPGGSEFWIPRRHEADDCGHGCRILNAVGRLDADVTLEAVQERMDATSSTLAESFPDSHRDDRFVLQPLLDYEVAGVSRALWVLMGAVGLVLLIACANVANLFLIRATARRDEVRLRATLGASRWRIRRQLLVESGLVAGMAASIGLAGATVGVAALQRLAPDELPRFETVSLDTSAVLFSLAVTALVVGLFGGWPALQASRHASGRGSARGATDDRGTRASRSLLLTAEVALSLTLLLGAGVLVRTLAEMNAVELGFETDRIERFRVSVPETRYDSIATGDFLSRLEVELSSIPGVSKAGWGFGVPMASGSLSTSMTFSDREPPPPPDRPSIALRPSNPGLIDAMGTRLVRGRWISDRDVYGAPHVAVVNEALVRAHFSDRDPIGVQVDADVSWGFETSPPMTIVGVVEDVITRSPTEEVAPAVYVPNRQFGAGSGYVFLQLEAGVASAIPEARAVIRRLDPSLAIWDVTTVEEAVSRASTDTRFYATLLTGFSVLALALAAVGLYGVVAYTVSRRTREIGVRIALGADAESVMGLVARQGVWPAALGVVVGLGLWWVASKALGSLLFGVTRQDPATLIGATGLMLGVFALATLIPARRATKVPPSSALRAE